MEVDGVGTRPRSHVVHAAQEVVRVAVHLVRRPRGQDVRPAARDLDGVVSDAQESQDSPRRLLDRGSQLPELVTLVKVVFGLPPLARGELRAAPSHRRDRRHDPRVDGLVERRLQLELPDERRKHRDDVRGFDPRAAGFRHRARRGRSSASSRRQPREGFGLAALGLGDGAGAVEDHQRALVNGDVDHLAVYIH